VLCCEASRWNAHTSRAFLSVGEHGRDKKREAPAAYESHKHADGLIIDGVDTGVWFAAVVSGVRRCPVGKRTEEVVFADIAATVPTTSAGIVTGNTIVAGDCLEQGDPRGGIRLQKKKV